MLAVNVDVVRLLTITGEVHVEQPNKWQSGAAVLFLTLTYNCIETLLVKLDNPKTSTSLLPRRNVKVLKCNMKKNNAY